MCNEFLLDRRSSRFSLNDGIDIYRPSRISGSSLICFFFYYYFDCVCFQAEVSTVAQLVSELAKVHLAFAQKTATAGMAKLLRISRPGGDTASLVYRWNKSRNYIEIALLFKLL